MSDEIKKPELVNAGEEKQLDEKDAPKQAEASEEELSKAVGGVLDNYSRPIPPRQIKYS